MPRYLEIAAKAAAVVDDLMLTIDSLPTDKKDYALSQILYLYNLGIRTAPRATQSTVRLNAVKAAARNQPAKISIVEKSAPGRNGVGTFTYKAINIVVSPSVSVQDGDTDE